MVIRTAPKFIVHDETPPSPTPAMLAYVEKVTAIRSLIPEKQRYDRPGRPPSGKVRVTMLLKPETIERFKATGKGWQARMSDALDVASL